MTAKARTILVTGAASGIGAAVCRHMADPGVQIIVHTRTNREGAERTAAEVVQAGGTADILLADLSEAGAGGDLIKRTVELCGGLDVLVANAGYADRKPLSEVSDADYRRAADTIAGSFFEMGQAVAPHLVASPAGRIVAVSAFGPHVWRTNVQAFPATAAAKAALEALVRALSLELAPEGVTVNAVAPGFIRKDAGAHVAMTPEGLARTTSQIPMGRVGETAEVAAAIAFLASDQAAYITGQVIHVNGGLV